MNPMNWISATGRSPCEASPIDMPAIMPSASGVSCTRPLPNFSCNPAVARNTPPLMPMSSPITTTLGSCSISHACARLMASIIVTLAMEFAGSVAGGGGVAARRFALLAQVLGESREDKVEHGIGRLLRRLQILLDGRLDERGALAPQGFLAGVVPGARRLQISAQAQQRFAAPRILHLVLFAIARRIVGRRVIAQAIRHRLDNRRPGTAACGGNCLGDCMAHRDDIVAVDLDARYAGGYAFLRERCAGGLIFDRY